MKLNSEALQYLISPNVITRPVRWEEHFGQNLRLEVEIGSGLGEYIVRRATEDKGKNFIGIEYDHERIMKSLRRLHKTDLNNVRFLQSDARLVFERLISPSSLSFVYSLFPCPWPKKKHAKHRLFNQNFLQLINSRLVPDGKLKIVTDHYPYVEWLREEILETGFSLEEKIIDPQFDTKFEKKWMEGGQEKFFELNLIKKKHMHVDVIQDIALEEYFAPNFCPDSFSMEHLTGQSSIIFKEYLYDRENQKVMIRVVIIEKNIKQHLWISVVKQAGQWRIFPSEGAAFIPTEGVKLALETVLKKARQSIQS